jgi:hypothetical protein
MLNPSVERDGEQEGQHNVDFLDCSSRGLHFMPQRVVLLVLSLVWSNIKAASRGGSVEGELAREWNGRH